MTPFFILAGAEFLLVPRQSAQFKPVRTEICNTTIYGQVG